jgi:hypothetical protein
LEDNSDKIQRLQFEIQSYKEKSLELIETMKCQRRMIGENVKSFISYYGEGYLTQPPSEMPESVVFVVKDMDQNNMEIRTPSSLDPEIEYIMHRLPMTDMDNYFYKIREYAFFEKQIISTKQLIVDLSNTRVFLLKTYETNEKKWIDKRNLVEKTYESLRITQKALVRKRSFRLNIACVLEESIREGFATDPSPPTCPICLDETAKWATTNCNHTYCKNCICKSLDSIFIHPTKPYICALCREEITSLSTPDPKIKYQLDIKYIHTSCYV